MTDTAKRLAEIEAADAVRYAGAILAGQTDRTFVCDVMRALLANLKAALAEASETREALMRAAEALGLSSATAYNVADGIKAALAGKAAAERALRKYGRHTAGCPARSGTGFADERGKIHDYPCACGLAAALSDAKEP